MYFELGFLRAVYYSTAVAYLTWYLSDNRNVYFFKKIENTAQKSLEACIK